MRTGSSHHVRHSEAACSVWFGVDARTHSSAGCAVLDWDFKSRAMTADLFTNAFPRGRNSAVMEWCRPQFITHQECAIFSRRGCGKANCWNVNRETESLHKIACFFK